MVDQVTVPVFPLLLPFQIHSFWRFAADEINKPYEFRIALRRDADGVATYTSPLPVVAEQTRLRIRLVGLVVTEPGAFSIAAEIRATNADTWISSPMTWPLRVTSSL